MEFVRRVRIGTDPVISAAEICMYLFVAALTSDIVDHKLFCHQLLFAIGLPERVAVHLDGTIAMDAGEIAVEMICALSLRQDRIELFT